MSGRSSRQALLAQMHEVVLTHPNHVAVWEQERKVTYAEFGKMITSVYRALRQADPDSVAPIGLLLDRSALAYASMWASISLGRAYVPLNTKYPSARLRNIIEQAGIEVVVCDSPVQSLVEELCIDEANIIVPASANCDAGTDRIDADWWNTPDRGDVAYVLYTSGSTGQAKGVPITYDNLIAFIDNLNTTIEYRSNDVCSQVCELSFDFSVQEIYHALLNGCTLCPARRIDLFNPVHFIANRSITVWIAVPSLARVILNNGVSIGDALHSIRVSIFNGEALTAELARNWHRAAPNSEIWNMYGPTECTVAVTSQRWSDDLELVEADVISIGAPFSDCETALFDKEKITKTSIAAEDSVGELLLSTPQSFAGYADLSLSSPFVSDADGTRFYRTGDRVLWRAGRLFHLGRIDYQVKIGGHRIELMEVECCLRRELETESLAVIAHPAQRPTELVLFIAGRTDPPQLSQERLGLPEYMLPKRTVIVDELPTTPHGKLDRTALQFLVGIS